MAAGGTLHALADPQSESAAGWFARPVQGARSADRVSDQIGAPHPRALPAQGGFRPGAFCAGRLRGIHDAMVGQPGTGLDARLPALDGERERLAVTRVGTALPDGSAERDASGPGPSGMPQIQCTWSWMQLVSSNPVAT